MYSDHNLFIFLICEILKNNLLLNLVIFNKIKFNIKNLKIIMLFQTQNWFKYIWILHIKKGVCLIVNIYGQWFMIR